MEVKSVKQLNDQYKNSSNLDIRINIHALYSTNKKDWFSWLFEQFEIQEVEDCWFNELY